MRTSSSFALPWFVKPVLLLMTGLLLSQSVLTTAQQPTPQPVPNVLDMLTASGDAYLSSMSSAALLGTELMSTMEMIKQTPIEQLSEASIIDARTRALDMARDSAVALGAVDDLSQSIRTMSPTSPTALDVSAVAQGGLPAEMRQYMIDEIGLSAAQVDALQQQVVGTVAARQDIKGDGLPDATRQSLEQIGFSPDEIGQVASALGSRGLFDPSIQTRLDQFKSSQDDVASNRTRALILYVQLLGTQIGVRQSTGVAPRPLSETDTYALAQDELRLLIHTAQLEALWGNDPSLDKGEGHWWFIERYAHRAGERIEQLTLDTQNRGLIVDLLLVEQMETLALSARSGDPAYVKAELDRLAELLAIQLGQPAFLAQQRQEMRGKINGLAQVAAPGRREQVEWQVNPAVSSLVAANSVGRIQEEARLRAQLVSGDFDELDEANNQMDLLFAAGLPNLDEVTADVINTTITVLSDANTQAEIVSWIKAILTGDTDNPMFMAANVVMSLIPVIGVIPDIATLVLSDNTFEKALSLLGIVGSLGEIINIIPGAQAIGGAAFLTDAAATVLKIAVRRSADMLHALNALPLPKAFQLAIQLVSVAIPRIIKVGGDLLTKDGLVAALMSIFEATGRLWESFVSFVYHGGIDLLSKIEFDEGGVLLGRVLNDQQGLADETMHAIDQLGDDLAKYGDELEDATIPGLADTVETVGVDSVEDLLSVCLKTAVQISPAVYAKTVPGLAHAQAQGMYCQQALQVLNTIDKESKKGFDRLLKSHPALTHDILTRYQDKWLLELIGNDLRNVPKTTGWGIFLKGLMNIQVPEKDIIAKLKLLSTDGKPDRPFIVVDAMYGMSLAGTNVKPKLKLANENLYMSAAKLSDFETSVAVWLGNRGKGDILCFGDPAVVSTFKSTGKGRIADFVSVLGENEFILTEVKSLEETGIFKPKEALDQIKSTISIVRGKIPSADFNTFEVAISKQNFKGIGPGYSIGPSGTLYQDGIEVKIGFDIMVLVDGQPTPTIKELPVYIRMI